MLSDIQNSIILFTIILIIIYITIPSPIILIQDERDNTTCCACV